jgi:hypothetical protein
MSATAAAPGLESFKQWMLKRGVLYVLTQTPMIALIIGYFWRWTDYASANAFTVILAFVLLPVWIILRRNASNDPNEPVHHFHKYALWALVPYVVYNFARIPMHFLLKIVFWDHWYDFGYELTGQPVDQWSSLIPGTFIHSLQGYVLALGFYILYKRHTLLNALIYVWIFLSTIYTWTYPTFILVDFQPPPKWFFVVWWAHFWMAIAAWAVPKTIYSPTFWSRFGTRAAKAGVVALIVVLYFVPVGFVFFRVPTWQFPLQNSIDQANFENVDLTLHKGPTLHALSAIAEQSGVQHARYRFTLRFGPRPYKDYINATKAMDAGPVDVTGSVLHEDEVIGYCSEHVRMLETPNNIVVPALYFPTLERMTYTNIPVDCVGPAHIVERLSKGSNPQVDVVWQANVTLIGDRSQEETEYEGTEAVALEVDQEVLAQAP